MNDKKLKKGLILEGGAMRGMFTSGVLDVFLEEGIEFDGAIGVSAGATFGCNLKSRQIGRAIRYNKRFAHDWRYCSMRSLILTGDMYGTTLFQTSSTFLTARPTRQIQWNFTALLPTAKQAFLYIRNSKPATSMILPGCVQVPQCLL